MTDTNDVFRKIQEMSKRVVNPRPQIPLYSIAAELSLLQEHIIPAIKELKNMRLIQCQLTAPAYIRLTLLGFAITR